MTCANFPKWTNKGYIIIIITRFCLDITAFELR